MTPSTAELQHIRYTWLRPRHVAARCGGVSVGQVYEWIDSGELRAFNAAKTPGTRADYRFKPEWVDEFERKRTLNP